MQARVTAAPPVRQEGDEVDEARGQPERRLRGLPRAPARACACSTPPAAPATSSSSRCGRSRTSSSRRSTGARSSSSGRCRCRRSAPKPSSGIEINAYAAELARVTIWIGEIQWMIRHGLGYRRDPILRPLHHIECRDALLDLSDPADPREAEWPEAEFIVGNPPFLGGEAPPSWPGRRLRRLAVRRSSTVGCRAKPTSSRYWHEKARAQIEPGRTPSGRPTRDSKHPRWRQSPRPRAHQTDGRHLLRSFRRPVGSGRRQCPHKLHWPGRWN